MISAVLYRGEEGYTGCLIEGHSGWADAGGDIVCAAVSILGCTCVNSLESVAGVVPDVTANDEGILSFKLPPTEGEKQRDAQILMKALKQGLGDLADAYPQNLKLSVKNVSRKIGGNHHDEA
jgi:hypothetical protein